VWRHRQRSESWVQPGSIKISPEGQVYLGMSVQLRGQQSSNAYPILDCCMSAFGDMRVGLRIRNGQQEREPGIVLRIACRNNLDRRIEDT
jgi:hypothetical protein